MRATDDIVALVEGTGDPAFAADATRTIIAWNQGAEKLLGLPAGEAVGRSCAQVIAGRDARGRPVCNTLCPALVAMQRHEPLGSMELQVDRRGGTPLWVAVSSIIPPNAAPCVVHLLRNVTEEQYRRSFVQQVLQGALALSSGDPDGRAAVMPVVLSPRQTTILKLLAYGSSTRSIARTLGISPATVRNHIQQILVALQAHSRLEAVIQALRRGLL
ncbi:MAG: LuxR C-terminal-related transcriptional regulator [Armatimonadota bacterium]|nr:LuxR C-terminal-related transcriptional regulator [Armatimonadota bacterium]MDR7539606.1 LuxR C-terminal-related transcriptional regulator [Armatimonadota bacterium]